MINWIYFVFIAQGIWSITSLIDKIVLSKGYIKNPAVYVVSNGLMNLLLVFLLPFVSFEPLSIMDFFIALLSQAAFTISLIAYYKAVEYAEISKVIILFQLGPIFVLLFSFLFLGEVLTKNHFIGFLFLLSAGLFVSYKNGNHERRQFKLFKLSSTFYLMLVSAIFGSIALVSGKHIFNATNFWSAFLWLRATGFVALCVLLMPSIRKEFIVTFRNMDSKSGSLIIFKMIIDFSAFTFAGYAVLNGPISLVAALASSITPLFVFLLTSISSVYFPKIIKEEINKKNVFIKMSAIVLMVIGIFLIS